MTFIWPNLLWLLLLIPVLIFAYRYMTRTAQASAPVYSGLQDSQTARSGWRKNLPPLLMLAAIACMLFAISRPVAVITLPSNHETIVLAVDLSGSMRATDIEPSRLEAAQTAIREFLSDVPLSTRVGIVTFGGTAATIQSPTLSRDQLYKAVDRFELREGTAIGSGIAMALKTIFPKIEIRQLKKPSPWGRSLRQNDRSQFDEKPGVKPNADTDANADESANQSEMPDYPVAAGSNESAAIILLSDGQNNNGPDPLEMATLASEYGVRTFTVGFGTDEGAVIGSKGRSMRVRLDEKTLMAVAKITVGDYFKAESASELSQVYQSLSSKLVFEKKRTEISSFFGAIGALLGLLAAGLSLLWFNRIF